MLGSREALVCLIEGGDWVMSGEVGGGVCQGEGAVFGDETVERISGPEGMKGKFCCGLHDANHRDGGIR